METNRNLSAALDKMDVRCKTLEEKSEKLKQYKKMVRNCLSLQCLHCQKMVTANAFGAHMQMCLEQPMLHRQSIQASMVSIANIDLSSLLISINQTMVRETPDNKPYTEYMIRVQYG